jgi:uracil permease
VQKLQNGTRTTVHLVTKGKVPIFLGSSFAFIAPIIKATELYGLAGTLSGKP